MRRLPQTLAPWLTAACLGVVGCGPMPGTPESAPPASAGTAPQQKAEGDGKKAASGEGQTTTPDRAVDTRKVVDVVKEEIKGGEATSKSGPTPPELLAAVPDPKLIQDEPAEIKVPKGFPEFKANINIPAPNPITKGKLELGKQLYFDQRISLNNTVSCATCHNPEKGWTDNLPTSVGIDGQVGGRNAPTVLNTVYGRTMFWDGRAPSLEGQAQGPIQNKIEMGDQNYAQIITRLRGIAGYQEQFKKVFGTEVTLDGMAKAIAAFERTALSGNSPYDRYIVANMDDDAEGLTVLSESQKRGMVLFGLRLNQDDDFKAEGVILKKANCTSCHVGFNFTDEQFNNIGVGWDAAKSKFADIGRYEISPVGAKDPSEMGAFKTPTIRDIARTAPYMHDGSQKTLMDVVEHYDKGGIANPYLDPDMKVLNLTPQEKADLVAFMGSLNGEIIQVSLPTLPPGPDGKAPNPADALMVPKPRQATADPHGVVR